MRKIEQRMVNAINNKVNYRESNTEVIVKGANVFVRLYDTYIKWENIGLYKVNKRLKIERYE